MISESNIQTNIEQEDCFIIKNYIDKKELDFLIKNYKKIDPIYLGKKSYKDIKHSLECIKKADFSLVYTKNKEGRYYSKYTPSKLKKPIIKFITKKDIIELDMKNCHSNILSNYAIKNNLNCPNIEFYCKNRYYCISNHNFSKQQFINSMFSSTIHKNTNKFLKLIHNEIYNIIVPHLKNNKLYENILKYSTENKPTNIEGSFLAIFCQNEESKIIYNLVEYCKTKKEIEIIAYNFDGLIVSPSEKINTIFLNDLNKFILESCKYPYIFTTKKINNLNIIESEEEELNETSSEEISDYDYALRFINKYGDRFIKYEQNFYFCNEYNIWLEIDLDSDNIYWQFLIKDHPELKFSNKMKNVMFFLKGLIKKVDKIDINTDTIFSFNNIVYDTLISDFRLPEKEEYVVTTCGYDYDENIKDKKDSDGILFFDKLKNILKQILGINYEYFMTEIAAYLGLEGGEQIFLLTASGSNGKTTLTSLMKIAYGNYFKLPNNSLITNSREQSGGTNTTLTELHNMKIICFAEPDANQTLNMSILKNLSGGDGIQARSLYGRKNKSINFRGIIIMPCNSSPPFDEAESAVKRRLRVIEFSSKFIDVFEIEEEDYNEIINKKNEILSKIEKDGLDSLTLDECYYHYKKIPQKKIQKDLSVKLNINIYGKLFMNLVIDFHKEKRERFIPKDIINLSEKLLERNKETKDIFFEYFEKGLSTDFITFKSIKEKLNIKNVKTSILKRDIENLVGSDFIEQKRINNINYRSVLVGFKEKKEDKEDSTKIFNFYN